MFELHEEAWIGCSVTRHQSIDAGQQNGDELLTTSNSIDCSTTRCQSHKIHEIEENGSEMDQNGAKYH